MALGSYYGQLKGPFNNNQQNLLPVAIALKIAIFSDVGHVVNINGANFELGKTGMLEIKDTKINSVYFMQPEGPDSFIEFMY